MQEAERQTCDEKIPAGDNKMSLGIIQIQKDKIQDSQGTFFLRVIGQNSDMIGGNEFNKINKAMKGNDYLDSDTFLKLWAQVKMTEELQKECKSIAKFTREQIKINIKESEGFLMMAQ